MNKYDEQYSHYHNVLTPMVPEEPHYSFWQWFWAVIIFCSSAALLGYCLWIIFTV